MAKTKKHAIPSPPPMPDAPDAPVAPPQALPPVDQVLERDVTLATINALERAIDRLARANELIATVARTDYGPIAAALATPINTMIEMYWEREQRSVRKKKR